MKKDQYITCYVDDNGKLCPMGEGKDILYAISCAKKHKHVLCKLEPIKDYKNGRMYGL